VKFKCPKVYLTMCIICDDSAHEIKRAAMMCLKAALPDPICKENTVPVPPDKNPTWKLKKWFWKKAEIKGDLCARTTSIWQFSSEMQQLETITNQGHKNQKRDYKFWDIFKILPSLLHFWWNLSYTVHVVQAIFSIPLCYLGCCLRRYRWSWALFKSLIFFP
jgi:hypothetical protein